ncbi:transcriptional coactivator YAP1-like isoform X2 [Lineus longissimus]|uniref:transcriptional coactivator YAP1-like isoform X2 n=1 Tax=Lineus longissimus TaxID=88925 RepID=UPI002B4EE4D8
MDQTQAANQVVHVRENSDSELENLFKVLNHKDGTTPGQIPYSMRKLPASFFKPPDMMKGNHSREGSADSTTNNNFVPNQGHGSPLPSGPGLQVQGIAHPRAHSSPASLQQTLSAAPVPPQHTRQQSFDISLAADLDSNDPLPPGWEMAKTGTGQRYFLNHVDQTTTWHDPRKSQSTTALNHSSPMSPPLNNQIGPSLPPGWEQAQTPDGEIYFINHAEKATSWFDPRLPPNLQRPGVRIQSPPSPQQAVQQQQQQQLQRINAQVERQRGLKLAQLQQEKERLRKRQEELSRQEMLLCTSTIQEENMNTPVSTPSSEMQSVTSGVDPFLGQGGTTDFHTRQESADSGLGEQPHGGMGTSYSLPRTPEDFLSNVDEMESQDGGHKMQNQPNSDFNMELQGTTSMDITSIGEHDAPNMDSDDLVPSLQEDISNELLNDVESVLSSNKMESLLTWL